MRTGVPVRAATVKGNVPRFVTRTKVCHPGADASHAGRHQPAKEVYDLVPNLLATNGWITDKPEGVAVTSTGRTYVVTDNLWHHVRRPCQTHRVLLHHHISRSIER
jgi:hypothetical protein